jgi:hypothetical protein
MNIEVARVKRKKEIISEIDRLDILMEQSSTTESQRVDRRKMKEELKKIWKVEEIKAKQRSREGM